VTSVSSLAAFFGHDTHTDASARIRVRIRGNAVASVEALARRRG
jgi:hypothetical protein